MKNWLKHILPCAASLSLATAQLPAQTVVFQETFENGYATNIANGGVWTFVGPGTGEEGTFAVVADEENLFGQGTANQFLRVTNAIGFQLRGILAQSEVVTMSFLLAKRETTASSGGSETLTCQFFGGTAIVAANRAHILTLSGDGTIGGGGGATYPTNEVARWDTIVNNSLTTITYSTPGGGTATLAPGTAAVWINGTNALSEYTNSRGAAGTNRVHTVTFQTFSTSRFSADLDNFTMFKGAHVMAPFAGTPSVHVTVTNLLFAEDFSSYDPGTPPTITTAGGLWATATFNGINGSWGVVEDTENVFQQGTANRFFRATSTHNFTLTTPTFSFPQEVVTYAFDFIGRFPEGDSNRWVNVDPRAGSSSAHVTSLRMFNATLRNDIADPANPSYGTNDVPIRVFTIFNNRTNNITYDRPDGLGITNLFSGAASVWLYHYTGDKAGSWEHLVPYYTFARGTGFANGAIMDNLRVWLDSNQVWRSCDIDNIVVYGSRTPLPTVYVAITNKLFSEDFEGYAPGTPPTTGDAGGKWAVASWNGVQGSWGVLEDAANAFGFGAGNRFLQMSNTHYIQLMTPVFEPQEALIYAFDYIGRVYWDDGDRWFNVDARNASGAAHTTSLRMNVALIRKDGDQPWYGGNDLPIRIVTIVNNREGTILYDRPDGLGTTNLSYGKASVWLYHYGMEEWEHILPEYIYARTAGFPYGAVMDRVRLLLDSGTPYRSCDLDNIEVFGSIAPPAGPIVLTATRAGGEIEIRWDGQAGKTYQVRYRDSLSSGTWENLGGPITPGADGEQLATDSLSASGARFYQVIEQ